MTALRDRIEKRLREEICSICGQQRDGECGQSEDFLCPLVSHLDEVIEVISATRDYSLIPYQEQVRAIVCSSCRTDDTSECTHRQERDCALDAYFPRIVAVIERELAADPGLS